MSDTQKLPDWVWVILFWLVILNYILITSFIFKYRFNHPIGNSFSDEEFNIWFLVDRARAASGEEIIFRVPLVLVLWLTNKSKIALSFSIVTLSLFFGSYHGYELYNFICQGVSGIIFCIAFLQLGAWRGGYFQALLLCSLIHLMVNLGIITIERLLT